MPSCEVGSSPGGGAKAGEQSSAFSLCNGLKSVATKCVVPTALVLMFSRYLRAVGSCHFVGMNFNPPGLRFSQFSFHQLFCKFIKQLFVF